MEKAQLIERITEEVLRQLQQISIIPGIQETGKIPLGISNRHIHISSGDLITLFGQDARLTGVRDLSQPGQYVSEQTVTLVGPKGVIEKVRILGPLRGRTQVEISISDCFRLGIRAPIRDSGDLEGSAPITVVGPVGSVTLSEGCIIAARHIHMHPNDAKRFGVQDGDRVNVKSSGPRAIVFTEVLVRVNENYRLEMHLDIDEANAASLDNGDRLEIIL
ncbi:MAG: phosphate propanoyltransferase [Firmicutes bacterium HGW-Firmicutes-14]|nr:MAG: phosphate propanoyltransferase [Firmicutes bacterium HGW-Firmicutes-14]